MRAEKAQPFYAFIDPDDEAFLNPDNMPRAICDYIRKTGQAAVDENDIGQVSRIIFESLALKYRYMFGLLCGVTGKKLVKLNIIGGGIQNEMLKQFTANAMGVEVLAGPVEATAAGNILVQAYGSGEIKDSQALRDIVKNTENPKSYLPQASDLWQDQYERFVAVCNLEV